MKLLHKTAWAASAFTVIGAAVQMASAAIPTPSAAPSGPHDPLNRDTPQSSVVNFLEAAHAKDYNRALRYIDFRKLPENERLSKGTDLAKQLATVLDRDPRFDIGAMSHEPGGDDKDDLPPGQELVDTFTVDGQPRQLLLDRVTLRSGVQVWLFSASSIQWIPKLVVATSDSAIAKHLPPVLVTWTLLDTPVWRWIALLMLVLVLTVLSRWLSRFAVFLTDKALARFAPNIASGGLKLLIPPLQLLFPVAVFQAVLVSMGFSALPRLVLQRGAAALLLLGFAWLCTRILDLFAARVRTVMAARKNTAYVSVLPLVSRVVKLVILLLFIAAILSNWGYNTSTILAGLGVGGLAIALAAQKTVENLFGGVAVISDRPVAIGDYCKFGDREGTVEDIGLRSTRIRTTNRTLVSVPNGLFSTMTIENFARQDKMPFDLKLNLRRDTTPDQVRRLLQSIGTTLKNKPKIEAGATPVHLAGLGSYSLDLEVFVYILTRNGDEFLAIRQDLLLAILDEIAAAGTALALPTQVSVSDSVTDSHSPDPAVPAPGTNGAR